MLSHSTQALGRAARKRYGDVLAFVPPVLSHETVHVRSTDVERTLLSAYSFLQVVNLVFCICVGFH